MEEFKIEKVDCEIHILGVTGAAFSYGLGVYFIFLFINAIVAVIALVIYLVIARQFFLASEKGEPFEYNIKFSKVIRKVPFLLNSFLLNRIIFSEGVYRGS
jgi:hypothetical protein